MDLQLLRWIAGHRCGALTWLTQATMNNARYAMLAAGACFFALCLRQRAGRSLIAAPTAAVLAELGGGVLKQIFARPRPPTDLSLLVITGNSFPSTHAMFTSAAVTAALVSWPWSRTPARVRPWAIWVSIAVLIYIGAAMVYLGAHWLTDVLAGWPLGGAIGIAVAWLFGKFATMRRRAA